VRAYRDAMSHDEAFVIMRREASVGMWDLRVIDTFEETLERLGMKAKGPVPSPSDPAGPPAEGSSHP
jgi:HD-GYP domain-containing protein (c-di-GMP phosphodiesterase class II)